MKKMSVCLFMLFFLNTCFADTVKIALDKVDVDYRDRASIERGAKVVSTYCLACHTLKYLRYNKLAEKQGILYSKMPFGMKINGVSPPDLSLTARVRGADWIYTYLHSFYVDPTRPSGFNNLLIENSAMLNILQPLQGTQKRIDEPSLFYYHQTPHWFDYLELQKSGTLTPDQFDALITDVVNFLVYASEPHQAERHQLGFWVLLYLILFCVLACLLKRAYWKKVKKTDE